MSSKAVATAAAVAILAGVTEVLTRHSTGLGIEYLDLSTESLSLFVIGANLTSVLVTPIAVFGVGYVLASSVETARTYAVVTGVFFLCAAISSVATLVALMQVLSFRHVTLAHTVLAYLEAAVSTGLVVTVSGLAGMGVATLFGTDGRRERRTDVDSRL